MVDGGDDREVAQATLRYPVSHDWECSLPGRAEESPWQKGREPQVTGPTPAEVMPELDRPIAPAWPGDVPGRKNNEQPGEDAQHGLIERQAVDDRLDLILRRGREHDFAHEQTGEEVGSRAAVHKSLRAAMVAVREPVGFLFWSAGMLPTRAEGS